MKKYDGKNSGAMSDKDYQPSMKQFAGEMAGKTTQYMERTDKIMDKEASKVKSQAHKGRYD